LPKLVSCFRETSTMAKKKAAKKVAKKKVAKKKKRA
jgi:hypothetical protein